MPHGPEKEISSTSKMRLAAEKYIYNMDSPRLLNDLMKTLWQEASELADKKFSVYNFPLTKERLEEEMRKTGRMAIFKPDGITMKDLDKIFPGKIPELWTEKGAFENEMNSSGWLWVEVKPSSPDRDMTEKDILKKYHKEGRNGQSLETYIIASYVSFLVYGRHFDAELSYTMLFGSRKFGFPLLAHTTLRGALMVTSMENHDFRGGLFKGYHSPMTGARSEEPVIK